MSGLCRGMATPSITTRGPSPSLWLLQHPCAPWLVESSSGPWLPLLHDAAPPRGPVCALWDCIWWQSNLYTYNESVRGTSMTGYALLLWLLCLRTLCHVMHDIKGKELSLQATQNRGWRKGLQVPWVTGVWFCAWLKFPARHMGQQYVPIYTESLRKHSPVIASAVWRIKDAAELVLDVPWYPANKAVSNVITVVHWRHISCWLCREGEDGARSFWWVSVWLLLLKPFTRWLLSRDTSAERQRHSPEHMLWRVESHHGIAACTDWIDHRVALVCGRRGHKVGGTRCTGNFL